MLRQRIISAAIAIPIVLGAVYSGGWPFILLLAVMVAWGWWELQAMIKYQSRPFILLGWLLLISVLCTAWLQPEYLLAALTLAIFLLLATLLVRYEAGRWTIISHAVTGFCYLALPLAHLVLLSNQSAGWRWVTLLLACVWSYDACAYFAGRYLGHRRPWPHISPKKSLEGVAGGLLGSFVAAAFFLRLFVPQLTGGYLLGYALLLGVGVGAMAQTGDLVESALKRSYAIKDSGHFLPGHGGLLDRIDSILFAAPFVYYFLRIFNLMT